MKVLNILVLFFLGFVQQGLAEDSAELSSTTIQEGIDDNMDSGVPPAALDMLNPNEDRNLLSSCSTCHKRYYYPTGKSDNSYYYPGLIGTYKTATARKCQYSCCTDVRNDPKCKCRQCKYDYVISTCPTGYKPVKDGNAWRYSYYIGGKNGPWGYKHHSSTKGTYYKTSQCYKGCCTDDWETGKGCCVKIP
jgi:hypothetical protein